MNRPTLGNQHAFSLIEILLAMALLAVTALLFSTLFTSNAKNSRMIKTTGVRDIGYYQVARFASDATALVETYKNSDAGTTGISINPCFRTCLDPTAPVGCTGGASPGTRCISHDGASPRTLTWYPLTIFDPANRYAVSGPNPAYHTTVNSADSRPIIRYTINGDRCTKNNYLDKMCPIEAKTEFHPVCPQLGAGCNEASSVVIRYTFSWSTATSVDSKQTAAFKTLTAQVEHSGCQITGAANCQPFYWSPTVANTSITTASSTGTSVTTNTSSRVTTGTGTNTDTCIADCFLAGTQIDTEFGKLPIELVSAGMKVWARNQIGLMSLAPVTDISKLIAEEYLEVTLESGKVLRVTSGHHFWDPKGQRYKAIGNFKVNDPVYQADVSRPAVHSFSLDRIKEIRSVTGPAPVYNFVVKDYHNYLSEGVLVHNTSAWCY